MSMTTAIPVREAPPPASRDEVSPPVPAGAREPILALDDIQGNIVGGFNKDFQMLLFLKIGTGEGEVANCKRWLASVVPFVATAAEVLAFNDLFKQLRTRRRIDSRTVQATWINIAFSYAALARLTPDAPRFRDAAFKEGLAARSKDLGDPLEPEAEGHPSRWVVGGPENEADIVLIVASDDQEDLLAQVAWLEDGIAAPGGSGVRVIFRQRGATLPGSLRGHEHFGFLDGVSQPGLRGRRSGRQNDFITRRQNPNEPDDQGKPGQDLLWPGEFIFGYPAQNPRGQDIGERGAVANAGPAWGRHGSFLVFRRLRQDVPGFHRFLRETAPQVGLTPERFGAKCVGRWTSGAPILRAPDVDDPALAADDCANNHFEFRSASSALPAQAGPGMCSADPFPVSPGDAQGQRCPFAGHIRKAYPRDDRAAAPPRGGTQDPLPNEVDTQTHRLLRRGIPFGEPFLAGATDSYQDRGDRGLLFLAYQTSIERQFEFVTQQWVNNPDFKEDGAGYDPILGQNNRPGEGRARRFAIPSDDGSGTREVTAGDDWVIPTGGGYFFAPSIEALTDTLAAGR
jgi:Dyp-type peroxidase family